MRVHGRRLNRRLRVVCSGGSRQNSRDVVLFLEIDKLVQLPALVAVLGAEARADQVARVVGTLAVDVTRVGLAGVLHPPLLLVAAGVLDLLPLAHVDGGVLRVPVVNQELDEEKRCWGGLVEA